MPKRILSGFFFLWLFITASCEYEVTSKTPSLSSISPQTRPLNAPSFRIIAIGKNFSPGAIIYFGGNLITTSYTSPTELTGTVSADLLVLPNGGSGLLEVYVKNPAGSDSTVDLESEHLTFAVTDNYQFPSPVTAASSAVLEAPEIIIDGNDKFYLFYSDSDGIYGLTSSNHGASWTSPSRLDGGRTGWIKAYCESAGTIDLIWVKYSGDTTGLMFARTTDGGANWSAVKKICDLYPWFGSVDITAGANGTLFVTFHAGDRWANLSVCFSRSDDHGSTWSSLLAIAKGKDPDAIRLPSGGTGTVFNYIYGSTFDITYTYTPDYGSSWMSPASLVSSGEKAVLAADSAGNLYCFYNEEVTYNLNIRRSIDGGASWGSPVTIGSGAKSQTAAALTDSALNLNIASAGKLVEASDDYSVYSGINFWRSTDKGINWTGPAPVSTENKCIAFPGVKIVITGNGGIVIAWAEADKASLSSVKIKTVKSTD